MNEGSAQRADGDELDLQQLPPGVEAEHVEVLLLGGTVVSRECPGCGSGSVDEGRRVEGAAALGVLLEGALPAGSTALLDDGLGLLELDAEDDRDQLGIRQRFRPTLGQLVGDGEPVQNGTSGSVVLAVSSNAWYFPRMRPMAAARASPVMGWAMSNQRSAVAPLPFLAGNTTKGSSTLSALPRTRMPLMTKASAMMSSANASNFVGQSDGSLYGRTRASSLGRSGMVVSLRLGWKRA